MYNLNNFYLNNKIYYELTSLKGSVFNIIKEIDNDNLDFLNSIEFDFIIFNNNFYLNILNNYSKYINNYLKLNKKILKNNINKISLCLFLLILILICQEYDYNFNYLEFKNKIITEYNVLFNINNLYNYFIENNIEIEDWFQFTKKIKEYQQLNEIELKEIKSRKDISFITYTNIGYINYVKNLIYSLRKCNFPLKLKVYCIDKESINELEKYDNNLILEYFNPDFEIKDIVPYMTTGWNKMSFTCIQIIYKELLKNDYVLYTDSDIVFENNYCIKYLINNINNHDLLIQNDIINLCTGFMFIKSNLNTKKILNYNNIDINNFECDQKYINDNKHLINYCKLPKDLFPVGIYYKKYNEWLKPFIIHFNWALGDEKQNIMNLHNKLYIKDNNFESKFLLFKGYCGFCDRLQCLLEIFKYCEITKRILVIDWNDIEWALDEKGFDYYFYLENIDYMILEDFKKIYDIYNKNKIKLSIYPTIWGKNLFEKISLDNIYNTEFDLSQTNNCIINDIINGKNDYHQNIIVYNSCFVRKFNYDNLFEKYFRIQNFILEKIYKHYFYINIISKNIDYICIHLRGGDKMVNIENKVHYNGSINPDTYIDNIIDKLENYNKKLENNFENNSENNLKNNSENNLKNNKNILIISDTQILIEKCILKLKDYNIYTTNNFKNNLNKGLHKLKNDELKKYKITKEELNIEMIIDFYFMVHSKKIINDDISFFSNLAKNIKFSKNIKL